MGLKPVNFPLNQSIDYSDTFLFADDQLVRLPGLSQSVQLGGAGQGLFLWILNYDNNHISWDIVPAITAVEHVELHPQVVLYMGVSENSVPLNPMVNDHYPY